jgi:DNA-binding NarL/FixJ family response regulator
VESRPPEESDRIRIVVADDHPVVRAGICDILEEAPDMTVVGEASNGEETFRLVDSENPDVLLVDIEMPKGSGIDVAKRLKDSGVHVLALSSYDDPEYASGLLESGASGYLTKEKAPALILEAVRAVQRGEVRWFVQPQQDSAQKEDLTEREKEVLRLMAKGHSNRELAEALFVSENTIRSHTASIYSKINVESAREAIAWAWKSGLMGRGDDE